jgi:release factor H-coupled RctB family protein
MVSAIGMPDIHPGRGNPVGAVFVSDGVIYPYLVGNDVGCGVGLFKTGLKRNKLKRDKWIKKLEGLETPWEGDRAKWLLNNKIEPSDMDYALGQSVEATILLNYSHLKRFTIKTCLIRYSLIKIFL